MELFTIVWASLGIILLVLMPGIALSFAIFPKKGEFELVYRIGISLVLGFVPFFILYFAEKNFLTPVNSTTTPLAIFGITILGIIVWFLRKK